MALAIEANGHAHGAHLDGHIDESWYRPKANRLGLWLFIASESFLFAGFISSRYIAAGTSRPEDLNQGLALFLTIVLLVSSISAYIGETAIAHDDRKTFVIAITTTILLAIGFMVGVAFEIKEAVEYFPVKTIFGSNFFMLVGLHAFHVVTGMLALLVVLILGIRGRYSSHNHWWVEAAVKYWHFVDLAWVVIYPTLYLVGQANIPSV